MIDKRKALMDFISNITIPEQNKNIVVNKGWYELKRRGKPQVTVTLNANSSGVDAEVGYGMAFEWQSEYMVRVWAPNENVRDWYYNAILEALKSGELEVGEDDDNVIFDLMLTAPPIKIEKTEANTHRSGANEEGTYLWENYGAIFYVNISERLK